MSHRIETEALQALVDATTPGPWASDHRQGDDGYYRTQVFPVADPTNNIATIHWHKVPTQRGCTTNRDKLAALIAATPALAAEVLELRVKRETVSPAVGSMYQSAKASFDEYELIIAHLGDLLGHQMDEVASCRRVALNRLDRINSLSAEIVRLEGRYQRECLGLNNESDPIGGDPPIGWKPRAEKAEADLAAARAEIERQKDYIAGRNYEC